MQEKTRKHDDENERRDKNTEIFGKNVSREIK